MVLDQLRSDDVSSLHPVRRCDAAGVRASGDLPRRAGKHSAGTGLVPSPGLLQVDGDVVTDRQAQSTAHITGSRRGGDGVGVAAVTLPSPRVARLATRNAGKLVGELGFRGLA